MHCGACGTEVKARVRRCPGCGAVLRGGTLAWWALVLLLVSVPLLVRYRLQPGAQARERIRTAVATCWREQARVSDVQAAQWMAEECRRLQDQLVRRSGDQP